jgi:hypothetical protein
MMLNVRPRYELTEWRLFCLLLLLIDLLLWGRNVNIHLGLLPAKYARPVSKERCHDHDNKYHQDSNNTCVAASTIAIVTHFNPPQSDGRTVRAAAGWLPETNDRRLEGIHWAHPSEIHEPTSEPLLAICFGQR